MSGTSSQPCAAPGPLSIVSIHDVMPATMLQVRQCLDVCRQCNIETVYLLVVPGLDWTQEQLAELRDWSDEGCLLAGHGWVHEARGISGWRHRLHSAILSRRVAEHLALSGSECLQLMRRCHDWFTGNGLPSPQLYVPPAWALGRVDMSCLPGTGFRYIETLQGILDISEGRWLCKPLLGYEADTGFRALSLRSWNSLNRVRARYLGPLRLAIHPSDLEYYLVNDLMHDLGRYHGVTLDHSTVRLGRQFCRPLI